MIKDILDTILKIEDDSKAQVVEAQKKAREIKETAEKENTERLNAVRAEAAASLLACISTVRQEWEEKYQQALSSQETIHTDFFTNNSEKINHTADKVLAIILKPKQAALNE